MTPVVELDGVSVEYESWHYRGLRRIVERHLAFQDVSLEFWPGEIVGVVGPNGSGKSTLLRTMCGIHIPVRGEVRVFGSKPDVFDPAFKRRIGYASSRRTALLANLPLIDSFTLHRELYSLDSAICSARLDFLIRSLDLPHLMSRPPREFSQGQRARAELGLLLLHAPKLLFLDELTEALDLEYLPRFLDLLREMRAHGATVFLISHRKDDLECADRLVSVEAGRVVGDERR
ncbi:MAG: viologen exporter family transport system ATP-binding protein [Bacillota bacterium]|nr:viologen exporter family transport system ATP-binding protein [Bacillota bacterium]